MALSPVIMPKSVGGLCPRAFVQRLFSKMSQRAKSSDSGEEANKCCGARQECDRPPCLPSKPDCYYATLRRYPCEDACFDTDCECKCEYLPLFDWLYYRPSDKATRQYQKTWRDCPPRTKKVCCYYCIPEQAPIERRDLKSRQACRLATACEANPTKFEMICQPDKYRRMLQKCPFIKAVNCRRGRQPPTCIEYRGLSDCAKACCPYPSFSECCISAFGPPHRVCTQCPPDNNWCLVTRAMTRLRTTTIRR